MSFHGINGLYNNNSVDGANNSQYYNGNSRGSQQSTATFTVGTLSASSRSAPTITGVEVGQSAGGAVNAVTNSGSNAFHGDLFYTGRSGDFNAFDPCCQGQRAIAGISLPGSSLASPTKTVHQQHQFGGSVGGPIIKDKLFFFGTFDGYRKVLLDQVLTSNPSLAYLLSAGSGLPNVRPLPRTLAAYRRQR